MPEYEYSAWVTVRSGNEQEAAERIDEAQGLLARMTTVTLHIDDSPPIENEEEDDE